MREVVYDSETMRWVVFALSLLGALAFATGEADAQVPDLVRARGLDQQGVRAFREGRFRDAIRFFNEAYRLGGPSSEIWNVARCHQRLDEPEHASAALERYLQQTELMPSERAEAGKELQELRRRPSQMVVDSDPSGASVTVDGKAVLPAAVTPLGVDVPAGPHRLRVERAGFLPYEANVQARFGRALLVTVKLVPEANRSGSGEKRWAEPPARRFLFSVEAGLFVPKLGDLQESARPAGHLAARYVWNPDARVLWTTGVRVSALSYDGRGAGPSVLCQLASDQSSVELGGLLTTGLSVRAFPRVRFGADVGLGVAGLLAGTAAAANCPSSYGVTLLAHAGLEASMALTPAVRLIVSPLMFQAHPAFDGAREIPPSTIDTGGLWWRLGATMGFAFDAK